MAERQKNCGNPICSVCQPGEFYRGEAVVPLESQDEPEGSALSSPATPSAEENCLRNCDEKVKRERDLGVFVHGLLEEERSRSKGLEDVIESLRGRAKLQDAENSRLFHRIAKLNSKLTEKRRKSSLQIHHIHDSEKRIKDMEGAIGEFLLYDGNCVGIALSSLADAAGLQQCGHPVSAIVFSSKKLHSTAGLDEGCTNYYGECAKEVSENV